MYMFQAYNLIYLIFLFLKPFTSESCVHQSIQRHVVIIFFRRKRDSFIKDMWLFSFSEEKGTRSSVTQRTHFSTYNNNNNKSNRFTCQYTTNDYNVSNSDQDSRGGSLSGTGVKKIGGHLPVTRPM